MKKEQKTEKKNEVNWISATFESSKKGEWQDPLELCGMLFPMQNGY